MSSTEFSQPLFELTQSSIWENYDWGDLEEGHLDCPELLAEMQKSTPSAVAAVIELTMKSFTFVAGGGWTPDWMEELGDERHDGSALVFLVNALEILREKDEQNWVRLATKALAYIACEGEAMDHDEGECWEAFEEISTALKPFYERVDDDALVEEIMASLALQLEAIECAHIRSDPFVTATALLRSDVKDEVKLRLLDVLVGFVGDDFRTIEWACECDGLEDVRCGEYADFFANHALKDAAQMQSLVKGFTAFR